VFVRVRVCAEAQRRRLVAANNGVDSDAMRDNIFKVRKPIILQMLCEHCSHLSIDVVLFLCLIQILHALKWSRDKAEYDAINAMLHDYVVGTVKKPQVWLSLSAITLECNIVDSSIRHLRDYMLVV
jgi:hypothetical protein